MASNLGRGRGYSGKNKDIIRGPATVSTNQRFPETNSTYSRSNVSLNNMPENIVSLDREKSAQKQNMGNNYRNNDHTSQQNKGKQQYNADEYDNSSVKEGSYNVHVLNKGENPVENSSKYSKEILRAISVSDENRQSVLFIDEKHHFLLKQINLLTAKDDGILLNQKLQHIGEILSKHYKDQANVRDALDAIASAAILDSRVTAKVSLLCCSVWFSCYQLFDQKLHTIFVEALTDKIDGLEVSLEGADQYLVNTVSLLSNIFTETKMLSAGELKTIACLIVQVIIALLECYTPLALKTLNIQLMVHGRKLYQSVPDKVESLSISARKLLIARQPPAPSCRIWLTLLADLCLCKLEPLPKYLEDFYSIHLDESQNAHDEKVHTKTNDCTNYSDIKNANTHYGEKSRRSDSSDLNYSTQSNGDRGSDHDHKYNDDVFEDKLTQHDSSFDGSVTLDSADNQDGQSLNMSQNSERKPRPILGAGARFGNMKLDIDLSVPPPPLNSVNQISENDIPGFCPSVPPPNFTLKQSTKQITSASQDSSDYWNTPPPSVSGNNRKQNNPTTQTSSVLSKRLDLNSWRQESNGPTTYTSDILDVEQVTEDLIYDDNNYHEPETSKVLLDKIKQGTNALLQRSEKRTTQMFYERRQSGHSTKDTSSEDNWEDTPISNLHISDSINPSENRVNTGAWNSNSNRNQSERKNSNDLSKPMSKTENRLINKDLGKQRTVRQSSSENDEKENNMKLKEIRGDRKTDKRDKKTTQDDNDVNEDRKPRNNGRRDQRSGGNMEVYRGGSYWTHDDRCDKEYDD